MIHVVLYQPEIPPNTGNIIRLCANSNSMLHLIHPLGFDFDDKKLRRAGLDYQAFAQVIQHQSLDDFFTTTHYNNLYACTTKGAKFYTDIHFEKNDVLLMGPETRGLPDDVLNHPNITDRIKIPMASTSRSLNLSNATAIILYEAWRQLEFNFDL